MITKKVLITVLALALLSPGSVLAAYTPYPGQVLDINRASANPPLVDIKYSELLSVNGTNLAVSIFGNTYTLDAANAQILNQNRTPITLDALRAGDRINVFGILDAANSSLVRAQIIRTPLGAGTAPPPGDPPPDEPPPDEPPPEQPEDGMRALYRYVTTGESQADNPNVQRHLWDRSLDNWNNPGGPVGSQNLALVSEAATGDYEFFAELARLSKEQGNFGREFGSPYFYFSAPIVSKMAALHAARQAGDTQAANDIALDLKTTWSIWALAAVPGGINSIQANLTGQKNTYPGDPQAFSGAVVAVAGERWNVRNAPTWNDQSPLLAWALDLPRSGHVFDNKDLRDQRWWAGIVAQVTGEGNFRATTPPEAWGLTAADREKLRRIVLQGDKSALNSVLADISAGGGVWRDYVVRIRRTSEGAETIFFRSSNGNKPAHAATSVTKAGMLSTMRPCGSNASGANRGFLVWVDGGTVYATAEPTRCSLVSQPELGGNLIYSVVLQGKNAYQGSVTNADPTPPGDVAPPPDDGGGSPGGGGDDRFDRPPFDF